MTDFLTVLRARSGARLTKAWRANPEGLAIAGYEDAKTFDATRIDVPDLHGLHASLQGLRDHPDRCVIRGAYPPLLAAWAPFLLFLMLGEAVLIRTEA